MGKIICGTLKALRDGDIDVSTLDATGLKLLQNDVNHELYLTLQNKDSRDKYITTVISNYVNTLNSFSGENASSEANVFFAKKIMPEISRISAIANLDINKFSHVFKSFFGLSKENGFENKEFPLLLQEEAMFQGASFLLGSGDFSNEMLAQLNAGLEANGSVISKGVSKALGSTNTNIWALDAVGGSGKTKMVANSLLRIAEKLGKDKKTLVSAAVSKISTDILDEVNTANISNKKAYTVSELYDGISDGSILLDEIDTLLIDEATLIDYDGRFDKSKDRYITESASFSKLYNLVKSKNSKVKLILLGDSNQMSKIIGDVKTIEDKNEPKVSLSFKMLNDKLLKPPRLVQSFRTSSLLVKNIYDEFEKDNANLFSKENPLKGEYAVNIKDNTLVLGLKESKNNISEETNKKEARLKTILDSFTAEVAPGLTLVESIKRQAGKGKFSLIIATDLDISEDELIAYLSSNNSELKILFDKKNKTDNPNYDKGKFDLELNVFTKKLSNVQGSEADYVIAEISNENNLDGVTYFPSDENLFKSIILGGYAKDALYTLMSRGKKFINVINNTTNVNINTNFSSSKYGIIDPRELKDNVDKAKELYNVVYENTDWNNESLNKSNNLISINWGTNNPTYTTSGVKTEEVLKVVQIPKNEKELKKILEEVDKNYPEEISFYKNNLLKLIDSIKKEKKDSPNLKVLINEAIQLENIINIKSQLIANAGGQSNANSLSKALDDVNAVMDGLTSGGNPKLKTQKEIAQKYAELLSDKGFAYTYMQTDNELSEKDRVKNEEDIILSLMKDVGITGNVNVDASIDAKFKFSGLMKDDNVGSKNKAKYFVRKEGKDAKGNDIIRLYVVATVDNKGTVSNSLLMTTEVSLWGGVSNAFRTKVINEFAKPENKDKVTLELSTDKNINSLIEMVSSGSIIRGDKLRGVDDFKQHIKDTNPRVKLSNGIYTVIDKNSKYRGRQLMFYTYSKNIDLDSDKFFEWSKDFIENSDDLTKATTFYKEGDINHAIGVVMLNNEGTSTKEIYEATKEIRYSSNNSDANLVLKDKTTDSSIKTLIYYHLKLKGVADPLNPTNTESTQYGALLEFLGNGKFSYYDKKIDKQVSKSYDVFSPEGIEQANALLNNLSDSDKEHMSKLLTDVFKNIGTFAITNNKINIDIKDSKAFAKVNFGKVVTIAETKDTYDEGDGRVKDEQISDVIYFNINSLFQLVDVHLNSDSTALTNEGDALINNLDLMFKTNTVTKEGFIAFPKLIMVDKNDTNTFVAVSSVLEGDIKDKLTVNLDGFNKPTIIIDTRKLNNFTFVTKETKAPKVVTKPTVKDTSNETQTDAINFNKDDVTSEAIVYSLMSDKGFVSYNINSNYFSKDTIMQDEFILNLESGNIDNVLDNMVSLIVDNKTKDKLEKRSLDGEGKGKNKVFDVVKIKDKLITFTEGNISEDEINNDDYYKLFKKVFNC